MKLIPPPQINTLNELLDVVLHPEKLQKYLQLMVEYRDAITERLEVYATKDAADTYLNQVQDQLRKANESIKQAAVIREDAEQAREQATIAIQTEKQAWAKTLAQEQQTLVARAARVAADETSVKERETSATQREAKIASDQQANAQRKTALDREYDKLNKMKDTLKGLA